MKLQGTMPPWLTELIKLLGDKAAFIMPAIAAIAYAGVTFGFFHWLRGLRGWSF